MTIEQKADAITREWLAGEAKGAPLILCVASGFMGRSFAALSLRHEMLPLTGSGDPFYTVEQDIQAFELARDSLARVLAEKTDRPLCSHCTTPDACTGDRGCQ